MTAPVAMDCPTDETLAAFIDGRLDADSRRRVIEHMTACGDCRDIVLTAPEAAKEVDQDVVADNVRRFRPKSWQLAAALIGAAAVVVLVWGMGLLELRSRGFGENPRIKRLVEITSATEVPRTLQTRVSGGFAHAPLVEPKRGNETNEGDQKKWLLTAEVGRLEEEAKKHPTAENRHALATAYVLVQHFDDAIPIYESLLMNGSGPATVPARIRASKNVPLLIDLSSAYYGRAFQTEHRTDLLLALEAATRALTIDPKSKEASWNRASILDALELVPDAKNAWNDYLRLDSNSEWAKEAREHLEALDETTQSMRWENARPALT